MGHKLNPANSADATIEKKFNGMTYYTYASGFGSIATAENVAIIGASTSPVEHTSITPITGVMKGYSSISGISLNVKVNQDVGRDKKGFYAPIAKEMYDNSIVYAVNVKGSYEIGCEDVINLSGLVGLYQTGKIFINDQIN